MGSPYINIDVVAVDSNNDGILDAIDEAAMLAAKTDYVRRFDINFDGVVGENDDAWFDATRANNPDLNTIRDNIKTGVYQELIWDTWSCCLVALDPTKVSAFAGSDSSPGWTHIHQHPYANGYACGEFAADTAISAYKALGYGCLLVGAGISHGYNMFWIGGDWHNLNNWGLLEPQTGGIYNAGQVFSEAWQTTSISFFDYTSMNIYGYYFIKCHLLNVNYTDKTVEYNQDLGGLFSSLPLYEEQLPSSPYTFNTKLGKEVAMTVIFCGSVSVQEGAGELVTITVTLPDASTEQATVTTQADKAFSTEYSNVPGNYKAKARVEADALYQGAESEEVSFVIGKEPRIITLAVG